MVDATTTSASEIIGGETRDVQLKLALNGIGAIALDPLDTSHPTLVAGTGRFSSFSSGGQQEGVLLTTDGENWTLLNGMANLNISGVAPRGDVIVSADERAGRAAEIWRSKDKGVTW